MNMIFSILGLAGGVFCIQPIIYKGIMEEGLFELADAVLEKYYKAGISTLGILREQTCTSGMAGWQRNSWSGF